MSTQAYAGKGCGNSCAAESSPFAFFHARVSSATAALTEVIDHPPEKKESPFLAIRRLIESLGSLLGIGFSITGVWRDVRFYNLTII